MASPIPYVLDGHPLRHFLDKTDIKWNYTFRTTEECQYVKDLIGNSWLSWNPEIPNFISAQTGTGKNTFVEDEIIKTVLTQNRKKDKENQRQKILLILNRTALKRKTIKQLATTIAKYTGDFHHEEQLADYSPLGIDKHIHKLGDIFIVTYQSLSEEYGKKLLKENHFEYVILDECHFFTSDSLFNAKTQTVLCNILQHCIGAIRIYMSSTIETVFEPIIREEYKIWKYIHDPQNNGIVSNVNDGIKLLFGTQEERFAITERNFFNENKNFEINFYDLEKDYSYISNINFFSNNEDLLTAICENDEKWIIFVSSREEGAELGQLLNGKKIRSIFLTSDSKGDDKFDEISEKEFIEDRVLIATSVIDNGINIKDDALKNIAVMLFDRTEFLQMIGRLRIKDKKKEKINLWVKSLNPEELENMMKNHVRNLIDRIYLDTIDTEEKSRLIKYYLGKKDGYDLIQDNILFYSRLSIYYLIDVIESIKSILINNSHGLSVDSLGDSYNQKFLKVFYYSTDQNFGMADAVCRTLKGLSSSENQDYIAEQIGWELSERKDDSFLCYIYQLRIKDLKKTIENRERKEHPKYFDEKIPEDNHPKLTDEKILEKINQTEKILKRFGAAKSAYEELYYWLELDVPEKFQDMENFSDIAIDIDVLLSRIAIPGEEYDKHVAGKKCDDLEFLENHFFSKGDIEKQNPSAKDFCVLLDYFSQSDNQNYSATQLMNRTKDHPYLSKGIEYRIKSVYKSPKGTGTYYAVVKNVRKQKESE